MCKGIYVIPSGVAALDVWSSWTATLLKKQAPQNDQFLCAFDIKEWFFQAHLQEYPPTVVGEQWQNLLSYK